MHIHANRDSFLLEDRTPLVYSVNKQHGGVAVVRFLEQAMIHMVNEPRELNSSAKTHPVQLGEARASSLEEGVFVLSH